ncbi:hypothetical protein [Streptomyces sp. NPDC054765]
MSAGQPPGVFRPVFRGAPRCSAFLDTERLFPLPDTERLFPLFGLPRHYGGPPPA